MVTVYAQSSTVLSYRAHHIFLECYCALTYCSLQPLRTYYSLIYAHSVNILLLMCTLIEKPNNRVLHDKKVNWPLLTHRFLINKAFCTVFFYCKTTIEKLGHHEFILQSYSNRMRWAIQHISLTFYKYTVCPETYHNTMTNIRSDHGKISQYYNKHM